MSDVFKIIGNICNNDKEVDQIDEYNGFLTNRFFSYFPDTILFANEINHEKFGNIYFQTKQGKKSLYDYYVNLVRKQKRFTGKWSQKDIKHERLILNYIRTKYNVDDINSKTILDIYRQDNPEILIEIEKQLKESENTND